MKKSILGLIVLLAVLIVTCVYQKTYTIYSTSPKELILVERKTTVENQNTVKTISVERKEEKTSTLPVISEPTPSKDVEETPTAKTEPALENKPVIKTKKIVEKKDPVASSPATEKNTPAPKVPAVITPATGSKETNTPKPPVVTEKTKPVTQTAGEKEIVDYIMWALKNRDIALKNRNEVEARIQELITKALQDRQVVLDERSKNEIILEQQQTALIDARDASYESVINPKTTNHGEK